MSAEIEAAMQPYVERQFRFLAMRLRPEATTARTAAPHPICYTYDSDELVYPMIISKVSAAPQNEIVLYVLAGKRYACANWSNSSIDEIPVMRAAGAGSGTDYEQRLKNSADIDLHLFVTEYAASLENIADGGSLERLLRVHRGDGRPAFLTRLRGLLTPTAMDRDVELVPASNGGSIYNRHAVGVPSASGMAPIALIVGLASAGFAGAVRKKSRGLCILALLLGGMALVVL